jgi:hypothetical protein
MYLKLLNITLIRYIKFLHLSDILKTYIKEYKIKDNEPLFQKEDKDFYSSASFGRIVGDLFEKILGKRLHLNLIRHSYISHFLENPDLTLTYLKEKATEQAHKWFTQKRYQRMGIRDIQSIRDTLKAGGLYEGDEATDEKDGDEDDDENQQTVQQTTTPTVQQTTTQTVQQTTKPTTTTTTKPTTSKSDDDDSDSDDSDDSNKGFTTVVSKKSKRAIAEALRRSKLTDAQRAAENKIKADRQRKNEMENKNDKNNYYLKKYILDIYK